MYNFNSKFYLLHKNYISKKDYYHSAVDANNSSLLCFMHHADKY